MPELPEETSIDPASPDYIIQMARSVLGVDYRSIHVTPVGQAIIGWMRAAHDQILAIGELVRDGRTSATGPNARTVMEITLRLMWLLGLDDRAAGLRAQFEGESRKANSHPRNLESMGLELKIEEATARIDLDQFGPLDTKLQGVASRVLDFSRATKDSAGFYHTWQAATQFTHATAALYEAYAPTSAFGTFTNPPASIDWSGNLNGVSMVICAIVGQILIDEGVGHDDAMSFLIASATAETTQRT
ncbi:hypothetical protein C3B61_13265 [Cryobacterium zongtaii]|uniref:Uncharacterized protein n=1 Tax=Cryobacterium zongtaii TaxID=1259217 RepID=A0A2S3ZDK9_9MICO|nr:hypothetical protein [Cryobacterium zongtaii]POH64410.1 hypothetical protein C3B61_13265 [Cryobacterium zongtaii]